MYQLGVKADGVVKLNPVIIWCPVLFIVTSPVEESILIPAPAKANRIMDC